MAERGARPLYKVNEFDVHNEGFAVNAFIETTRWFGIKSRLLVENAANFIRGRERTVYAGERDLSAVDTIIENNRHTGRRITLYLDGTF